MNVCPTTSLRCLDIPHFESISGHGCTYTIMLHMIDAHRHFHGTFRAFRESSGRLLTHNQGPAVRTSQLVDVQTVNVHLESIQAVSPHGHCER